MLNKAKIFCSCLLLSFLCISVFGSEHLFSKELYLIGGYSDQHDKWMSERGMMQKNSAGFEYFGRTGNEFGDFLTCDVQARLSYDSSDFLDEHWAVEIHNAWLEYKLGLGRNLRVGHFAPAYGLESVLDTHGTLFQTLAMTDVGFKKDWGAGYRGELGPLDSEISLQTGSGMGFERTRESFLATARVGNPSGAGMKWGLSALYGETLRSAQMRTIPAPDVIGAVSMKRIGCDARYEWGGFFMMGEITLGRNDDDNVAGMLMEVNYVVPAIQNLSVKLQDWLWSDDYHDSERLKSCSAFGVNYTVTRSMTVRTGLFHDWHDPDANEDTQIFVQLYYFGG